MRGKFILLNLSIGNALDLTMRTHEALQGEGTFLVEDTRTFKTLCQRQNFPLAGKKIESFHDHTDSRKIDQWLERATQGESFYILSEAGSCVISDPALPLIQQASDQGFEIESYPGVSSVVTALELSGLPATPFFFHGFLPRKKQAQEKLLLSQLKIKGTHLFFESCHRIQDTLRIWKELPSHQVAVCKDLTTKYQRVWRGQSQDLDPESFGLGQYVLGMHTPGMEAVDLQEALGKVWSSKGKKKDVAKLLAQGLQKDVKECYQHLI